MRILDINDNELQKEEIDFELGYLEPDEIFVQHHEAIEEQQREFHYAVSTFYFEDETSVKIENEDDPRVGKDDIYEGRFHYVPVDGEEPRQLRGIDLYEVEDKPYIAAKEAWDEYESIQRYKLYTEAEIAQRAEDRKRQARQEELLNTGLDRIEGAETNIESTNATVDDIILVMADLFGGEEEEV